MEWAQSFAGRAWTNFTNVLFWRQPERSFTEVTQAEGPSPGTAKKSLIYLFPLFWPSSWILRFLLFFSLSCMALDRVCKVFVPILFGNAIQELTNGQFPLSTMISYFFLSLLSTSVSDIQDTAFQRVRQHMTRTINLRVYAHLHQLSLKWHLNRNTGAALRIVDRGINSAANIINAICFEFVPMILDFGLVCGVLFYKYGGIFTVIVFVTMVSYVLCTISITEWRSKFRRQSNDNENELNQITVDSLLNFETVKYFTAERHETKRYATALDKIFESQRIGRASLAFLNLTQALIKSLSYSTTMFIAGYKVINSTNDFNIGDMISILTFLTQVFRPLSWLGSSYRSLNQNFIDMEKLFELMEQKIDVMDVPNAPQLRVKEGIIKFENVSFSYDGKASILSDISLTVNPGQTIAVVGPSGAGKSTLARLLLRFYDVSTGRITIDGQDISKVTQTSLRKNLGVVPQDTVLFNDTLRYNIRYGQRLATDLQVEEAATQARIHEFIMSSKAPLNYETKVGERGLRLSGGEKQRVAIARTLLKDPPILVLDEATSSLDTFTEQEIQASLLEITRGRTALVIAHRLSTVVKANEIVVLQNGRITERGTHSQLLELEGVYAGMWRQQASVAQLHHDLSKDLDSDFLEDLNDLTTPQPQYQTRPGPPSPLLPTSTTSTTTTTTTPTPSISTETLIPIHEDLDWKKEDPPKKSSQDFEEIELVPIPKLDPPPPPPSSSSHPLSQSAEQNDIIINMPQQDKTDLL
eukprot:TRINITY_DN17361_c0_g1_i1.p1 TRINITY_DN17361_c0_g1~~TRINITY_DN17361_c0_g1_i1.p1  ORF type:complete len:754 (-),score=184.14 TRINITY_DN17361_c0_g1_i1:9-2270(-)